MERKFVKKTTMQQFEVMVSQLEKNPEIARRAPVFGANREKVEELWSQIANKINAYGPPQRTTLEWKKIWADLKSRTKKKIAEIQRGLRQTGGGPFAYNKLTDLEKAIDRLVLMSTVATPSGRTVGLEISNTPAQVLESANDETGPTDSESVQPEQTESPIVQPTLLRQSYKRKKNPVEEQVKLIKKREVRNQQLVLEELKKQNEIGRAQAEALQAQAEASKKIAEAMMIQAEATKKIVEALLDLKKIIKQ